MNFSLSSNFISQGIGGGIFIYYAQYVLHDPNLVGTLMLVGMVPTLVGFALLPPIIKRIGKRNVAMIGCALLILGSLAIVPDPGNLITVCVGNVIRAFGGAATLGTFFAMLADTIEYGEWKTGMRTEGLVYSAGSFGTKAGTGLGAAAVDWGLSLGGYVGGQTTISASDLTSIHVMFIYMPIILSAIQIVILAFYKLDKLYPRIIKDLQAVKSEN
ncbi:MFS transporter [Paenibacillus durus]|uniref:MFS transporter n=1 Tax=Paenibacillus durus TaxID=44251 RepID=UPI001E390D54|nr:MFS transporter [Paenibacillus durus]